MAPSNPGMYGPAQKIRPSKGLPAPREAVTKYRNQQASAKAAKQYWEYNRTIDPNADPSKAPTDWSDKQQVKDWQKSGGNALGFRERRQKKREGLWHDPKEYRLSPTSTKEGEIAKQVEGHMHRRLFGSGRQEFIHDYDPRTGEKMDTGSYQFIGNKNDVESEKHRDLAPSIKPWYDQQEGYRQEGQARRGAFGTQGFGWVNQGGEPVRTQVARQMAAQRSGLNIQNIGAPPNTAPQPTPPKPQGGGKGGGAPSPPAPPQAPAPAGGGTAAPTRAKTKSPLKPVPMVTSTGAVSPVQPDRRKKSQLPLDVNATPVAIKSDRRTRAARTARSAAGSVQQVNNGRGALWFEQSGGGDQLVTSVGRGAITASNVAAKAAQAGHNQQKFRST